MEIPLWKHKLSEKWQNKIEATRKRDQKNFLKLRRLGWKVIRIWEHQVERSPDECLARILEARAMRSASFANGRNPATLTGRRRHGSGQKIQR